MELVDVVDAHDRPVAVAPRAEVRARNLRHRVVFVIVDGSDGRILVHRRAERKDVWPGWWDCAVGGVVAAGETYAEAAERELGEELGLAGQPAEVGGGAYRDDDVDVVGRVYRLTHDGPFSFADGEIVEARFVTRAELDAMLAELPFVPDTLAIARAAGAL